MAYRAVMPLACISASYWSERSGPHISLRNAHPARSLARLRLATALNAI